LPRRQREQGQCRERRHKGSVISCQPPEKQPLQQSGFQYLVP